MEDPYIIENLLDAIVSMGHFFSLHAYALVCVAYAKTLRKLVLDPKTARRIENMTEMSVWHCGNIAAKTKLNAYMYGRTRTAKIIDELGLQQCRFFPNFVLHGVCTSSMSHRYKFEFGKLIKRMYVGGATEIYDSAIVPRNDRRDRKIVHEFHEHPGHGGVDTITTEDVQFTYLTRISTSSKIKRKYWSKYDLLLEERIFRRIRIAGKHVCKLEKLIIYEYNDDDGGDGGNGGVHLLRTKCVLFDHAAGVKWNRVEQTTTHYPGGVAIPTEALYIRDGVVRVCIETRVLRAPPESQSVWCTRIFTKYNASGSIVNTHSRDVLY
jgi:hypothetical protein